MSYPSDRQPATADHTSRDHTSSHQHFGTGRFEMSLLQQGCVLVTVDGELDAANANELVDFALRGIEHADRVIIDLSRLRFFATAGCAALLDFQGRCADEKIRWAVVSSPAVDRALRICDPDATLPIRTDIDGARAIVCAEPAKLLQLIPESR